MKIHDLGALDGPVLIHGGAYSNLQAGEALLRRAGALGIPAGRMICTGDVTAYCADPGASVGLLRRRGGAVIAGNCERQLAAGARDCGCGFADGTACDLLSRGWFAHADGAVGEDARAWMAALPDVIRFSQGERRYAVIHGGVHDISRFIWPDSPDAVFAEELDALRRMVGPIEGVIAGHSGIAFQRRVAGVHWINAGVIGMPPHDGRPQTRFAVLTDGQAVVHRLDYDWQGARAAMEAAGLTQGYHDALASGYWPSEDVLPASLRRPPRVQGSVLASG